MKVKNILNCIKKTISSALHNIIIRRIVYYLCIVFFSAVTYHIIFMLDTSSFFVSEQLNKHIGDYYYYKTDDFIESHHRESKDIMPVQISELNTLLKPKINIFDSINESNKRRRDSLESIRSKIDSLTKIADKERSDAISTYRTQKLSVYQSRIDSMKNYLEGKDSIEMIINWKYVELAELEYEYAQKNAEVQSYIIEQWGSFISDSISENINQLVGKEVRLSSEIFRQNEVLFDLGNNINKIRDTFYRNRLNTVHFLDFLYYSFCVSTTVSFGDIAPNNGLTRALAVIELLLCIIMVGFILDELIKRRNAKNE